MPVLIRGEASMDVIDPLMVYDLRGLDPRGGVLVSATYWRPRPGDPDPELPGEKMSIWSYLPTAAGDLCPCGSGKSITVTLLFQDKSNSLLELAVLERLVHRDYIRRA